MNIQFILLYNRYYVLPIKNFNAKIFNLPTKLEKISDIYNASQQKKNGEVKNGKNAHVKIELQIETEKHMEEAKECINTLNNKKPKLKENYINAGAAAITVLFTGALFITATAWITFKVANRILKMKLKEPYSSILSFMTAAYLCSLVANPFFIAFRWNCMIKNHYFTSYKTINELIAKMEGTCKVRKLVSLSKDDLTPTRSS
ncbi:MAG: hypothetical protein L0207_06645 [Chlamydiae bacterium]|nr:hypothetical protein [Chlamydiota bacterium]